jgi:hypothetical protein
MSDPSANSAPLLYLRDTIVVNKDLRGRLSRLCDGDPSGKTVVLAARSIVHDPPDYSLRLGPSEDADLTGLNLVVVADSYAAPVGQIDASGSPGPVGGPGSPGADARFAEMDGGKGGPGGRGSDGTGGGSVTVMAHSFALGSVIADGAAGSAGGAGGVGGQGGPGAKGKPPDIPPVPPGAGGTGGPGGPGGNGGPGGIVTLMAATGTPRGSAAGGPAGPGGAGGSGGPGGITAASDREGRTGQVGPAGSPGTDGTAGKVSVVMLTDSAAGDLAARDTYWLQVVSVLGPLAASWAQWRTLVGEWYFRSWSPAAHPEYLSLAFGEFQAALRLDPAAVLARTYAYYLNQGMTVLGDYRTGWVEPDFDHYQQVAVSIQPLVGQIVANIITAIDQAAQVELNAALLTGQAAQLASQRPALAADIVAAQEDQQAAATREKTAEDAYNSDLAASMRAKNQLEAAQMQVQQDQVWDTIGTVFQVVAGIAEIGVGLVTGQAGAVISGATDLIPVLSGTTLSSINVSDLTGTLEVAVKGDQNITTWLQADGFYAPSQKTLDAVKQSASDLKGIASGTAALVSKALALTQADTARYQNLATQYQSLVKQLVQDVANLHALKQDAIAAFLKLDATTARQAANDANIQQLDGTATSLQAGVQQLVPGIRQLLSASRLYQDMIARYVFLATRAAEIWTLQDLPVTFDGGYVFPDGEEDAFFDIQYPASGRGDATALLGYASALAGGWAGIPELPNQTAVDIYNKA